MRDDKGDCQGEHGDFNCNGYNYDDQDINEDELDDGDNSGEDGGSDGGG